MMDMMNMMNMMNMMEHDEYTRLILEYIGSITALEVYR